MHIFDNTGSEREEVILGWDWADGNPGLACEGRWERHGIPIPKIVKRCRLLDGISGNKMQQKVSWGVQTEWGREPWGYVRDSKLDKGNHSEKALTWKLVWHVSEAAGEASVAGVEWLRYRAEEMGAKREGSGERDPQPAAVKVTWQIHRSSATPTM